jgi:hypothetical protein
MLIQESDQLNTQLRSFIIDRADKYDLTPLYYLCQDGFRKDNVLTLEEAKLYFQYLDKMKEQGLDEDEEFIEMPFSKKLVKLDKIKGNDILKFD